MMIYKEKGQLLCFGVLPHYRVFYLEERFREWIISLSTGKNLLSWA